MGQGAPFIGAATGDNSILLRIIGTSWTGPLKLSTGVICLWIYGLAVGDGYTAATLSHRVFVSYLAPSSYAIYLLHWPNARYWMYLVHGVVGPDALLDAHWIEFLLIALCTIIQAVCVTHWL